MSYVLIIDDDEDFASAVATVIKKVGHEVGIELSTKTAETSIQKKKPDLIILDVMFPENDSEGFEFARQLRNMHEAGHHIPVLMLTAINSKAPLGFSAKDIDDAWLPVDDFVEKPIDFKILEQKLNKLLKKNL